MDNGVAGQSAPYGHACMHCFKSKCKCVKRPEGDGCERCYRLRKNCFPSDSLRRRTARDRGTGSDERISELQDKVDSLVGLLQSIAGSAASSSAFRSALDGVTKSSKDNAQRQQAGLSPPFETHGPGVVGLKITQRPGDGALETSVLSSSPSSVASTLPLPGHRPASSVCLQGLTLPIDEVDVSLNLFRSKFLHHFPFIFLPSHTNAQLLSQERPFLLRAIVAVTATSTQLKLMRGKELKRILAQTWLLENQSSLDLLLGLLTYISWGYDQLLNRMGSLSRLMQMALSLIYDLRLNKPIPRDNHMLSSLPLPSMCPPDDESEQRSLEQQRAVLGCFLLNSFISSYFGQIDPMKWTPQMDKYLDNLERCNDCPSDRALAFQVRLQLLGIKVSQVRDHHDMSDPQAGTFDAPLPTLIYLKTAQTQLRGWLASLSEEDSQHRDILTAHVHYVELSIHEAFYPANLGLATNNSSRANTSPNFERLTCLWQSLEAIRSWIENFFILAANPSACIGFSFVSWAQLTRCLVVLYRLSTISDPSWDRQAVRDVVDILLVLEKTGNIMEQISTEIGESLSDGLFAQIAKGVKSFRAWAGEKRRTIPLDGECNDAIEEPAPEAYAWPFNIDTGQTSIDNMMPQMDITMGQNIDLNDALWFQDFFTQT